jgi:hypothetical protein
MKELDKSCDDVLSDKVLLLGQFAGKICKNEPTGITMSL